MKTKHGEVIELVWPEGNDEGELLIRGHFNDAEARKIFLSGSDELGAFACVSLGDEVDPPFDEDVVTDRCEALIGQARIERLYARWSQEAGCDDMTTVLRPYRLPGRGLFAVTRAKLFPRTPCHMSFWPWAGTYECTKCGRRFRGPTDPHNLTGPADCERLVGDEQVREYTEVYEELEPATNRQGETA